jgi:excisionase family DNA binding protein
VSRAEIFERKRLASIDNGKRLASISATAIYCGVSSKTIRRRISDGTIHGVIVGKRLVRVDLNEVDEKLLRPIPTTAG